MPRIPQCLSLSSQATCSYTPPYARQYVYFRAVCIGTCITFGVFFFIFCNAINDNYNSSVVSTVESQLLSRSQVLSLLLRTKVTTISCGYLGVTTERRMHTHTYTGLRQLYIELWHQDCFFKSLFRQRQQKERRWCVIWTRDGNTLWQQQQQQQHITTWPCAPPLSDDRPPCVGGRDWNSIYSHFELQHNICSS